MSDESSGALLVARAHAKLAQARYAVNIKTGHHELVGDEPVSAGGGDAGASPFGFVLAGLGACTAITLRMYAERKQWPVTAVHADIRYSREGDMEVLDRVLTFEGAVDDAQKQRMAEIAERTPVTLTLKKGLQIRTRLG